VETFGAWWADSEMETHIIGTIVRKHSEREIHQLLVAGMLSDEVPLHSAPSAEIGFGR
jgi:hypothetical protein